MRPQPDSAPPSSGLIAPAAGWACFLDLDGTLVELAETPDAIEINPGVRDLLQATRTLTGGALALISGRSLVELDQLIPGPPLPLAGQHGVERRGADGVLHRHPFPSERLDLARQSLSEFIAQWPGLLLEDKGSSLALHFRREPRLAGLAFRAVRSACKSLGPEFTVQEGKQVVELKPAGRDKGDAIFEFMAEAPFRGRTPVFVGDDATDEFGFAVVNRLGGHSIKVGPGPTTAFWRLHDVPAVLGWLSAGTPAPHPVRRHFPGSSH